MQHTASALPTASELHEFGAYLRAKIQDGIEAGAWIDDTTFAHALGVSKHTLSHWLAGRRRPHVSDIVSIARALTEALTPRYGYEAILTALTDAHVATWPRPRLTIHIGVHAQ